MSDEPNVKNIKWLQDEIQLTIEAYNEYFAGLFELWAAKIAVFDVEDENLSVISDAFQDIVISQQIDNFRAKIAGYFQKMIDP